MFRLLANLKEYKYASLFGGFFKLLEVMFELLLPSMMALIINQGVAQKDTTFILQIGALMCLFAVLGYGCALICQYYASRASQGFGTLLRNKVYKKILSFSFEQLDYFSSSTLTTRLTNDVTQMQVWVAMMIRMLTRAPFICIGSIVMTFFLDTQLALILLASLPVLVLIIVVVTTKVSPLYQTYQTQVDNVANKVKENILGIRVIRSFSTQRHEQLRFQKANDDLQRTGLNIARVSSYFNPLTSLSVNLVIVAVLYFGGMRIEIGNMSQGEVVAFINYVSQMLMSLLMLSNLIVLLTKSMASAKRINEVLDVETSKNEIITLKHPEASDWMLEFNQVYFAYPNSMEMNLINLSFKFKKNEKIGIIGATGSGKTTLLHLMARFHEANLGDIAFLGKPLEEFSDHQLRKQIAIAAQDATLFRGTIRENLLWGKPDATQKEVEEACTSAQALSFILEKQEGFDGLVERGGRNFSGGQKQRLILARTLLAKPALLLLDDTTSALDFITESKVRKELFHSDWIQCLCIVSQRISSVEYCDRIMVLDNGELIQMDTHDNLLQTCELYQNIYASQKEVIS